MIHPAATWVYRKNIDDKINRKATATRHFLHYRLDETWAGRLANQLVTGEQATYQVDRFQDFYATSQCGIAFNFALAENLSKAAENSRKISFSRN